MNKTKSKSVFPVECKLDLKDMTKDEDYYIVKDDRHGKEKGKNLVLVGYKIKKFSEDFPDNTIEIKSLKLHNGFDKSGRSCTFQRLHVRLYKDKENHPEIFQDCIVVDTINDRHASSTLETQAIGRGLSRMGYILDNQIASFEDVKDATFSGEQRVMPTADVYAGFKTLEELDAYHNSLSPTQQDRSASFYVTAKRNLQNIGSNITYEADIDAQQQASHPLPAPPPTVTPDPSIAPPPEPDISRTQADQVNTVLQASSSRTRGGEPYQFHSSTMKAFTDQGIDPVALAQAIAKKHTKDNVLAASKACGEYLREFQKYRKKG